MASPGVPILGWPGASAAKESFFFRSIFFWLEALEPNHTPYPKDKVGGADGGALAMAACVSGAALVPAVAPVRRVSPRASAAPRAAAAAAALALLVSAGPAAEAAPAPAAPELAVADSGVSRSAGASRRAEAQVRATKKARCLYERACGTHAPRTRLRVAPLRRRCPRRLARAQPLKRALHAPPSTSTSPGARPGAAGVQGRGRGGAGGGFPMGRRRRAERLGGEGEGSRRGGAARSTTRRSGARGGPDRSPPVGVRSRELRATSRATLRADSTHATPCRTRSCSVAPSLACSLARSGRALCSAV